MSQQKRPQLMGKPSEMSVKFETQAHFPRISSTDFETLISSSSRCLRVGQIHERGSLQSRFPGEVFA